MENMQPSTRRKARLLPTTLAEGFHGSLSQPGARPE